MSLLDSQIKNKSLSNAYIIEGEDLEYNLEYAKNFVKKVFDSYGLSPNLSTNPDFEIIDKDPIDIQTIRFLIKDMVIRPVNNKIKVYIIHNAQNLRIESANAMLKSLEELKDYSLIIFTADNSGKILPTIRSRCQIISLNTINEKIGLDMNRLSDLLAKVYQGDISAYYKEKEFLSSFNEEKSTLMEGMIKIFRDLIYYKYLGERDRTGYHYNIESLAGLNLVSIEMLLEKIESIYRSYRNNINFELSIENIFLNIYREGRQS